MTNNEWTQRLWDDSVQTTRAEAKRLVPPRAASAAPLGNRVGDVGDGHLRIPESAHPLADELEDLDESSVYEFLGFGGMELSCRADNMLSVVSYAVRQMGRSSSESTFACQCLIDRLELLAGEMLTDLEDAGELHGSAQRARESDAERQEQELTAREAGL